MQNLGLKKASITDLLANPWIASNPKGTSKDGQSESVKVSLKELMNITTGDQQAFSALNKGNDADSLSQDF